jgi:CheY-like chemotaxis protein
MASATNFPNPKKKILVTDDNQIILTTLSLVLQADGYEVATAASGAETVSRMQESTPDLILLDLAFPPNAENLFSTLEDGFTLMAWLRGMGGAGKTPIIVISGTAPENYQGRAQAAGVVATFQKPVDHGRLLKVIRATLEGRGRSSGSVPVPLWQR